MVRVPAIEMTTADFVVVGAGFAGLAIARRLAEQVPTARILLVDALTLTSSFCSV